jgi:hypothetical protein
MEMERNKMIETKEPTNYAINIFMALQRMQNLYLGSVPFAVKSKRRAKNRVARISRRKNRP